MESLYCSTETRRQCYVMFILLCPEPRIAVTSMQQSVVHMERTCRILSCSIVSCQIRQEGGNLPSWSKKQRAFSLRFLSVALSVSFYWFSTKKLHFAKKLPTSLFHTYTSNKYQRFKLAYLNKGYFMLHQ